MTLYLVSGFNHLTNLPNTEPTATPDKYKINDGALETYKTYPTTAILQHEKTALSDVLTSP